MKGRKPSSQTADEDIRELLHPTERAKLQTPQKLDTTQTNYFDEADYTHDVDEEHTIVIRPTDKKRFNARLAEQQKKIGCLIVLSGKETGRILDLNQKQIILGRGSEASYPLRGHGISRTHARIACSLQGVHYSIEDMDSKNGTYVNGKSIQKPTTLQDGDLVTLGGAFLLKFKKIEQSYLTTRTRSAIQKMRGGVIQVSDEHSVTFINETAQEWLALSAPVEPHRLYVQLLQQRVIRAPEDFKDKNQFDVWQVQIGRALYRCHAVPIYSAEGQEEQHIVGVNNVLLDASLESILEREMNLVSQQLLVASQRANAARQVAENANQAKSEFLARMSHELRTPLNAIIGYAELLIEEAEYVSQEDMSEDLGKIRTAGRHLLDLIDEVLDISRLEAGKMELHLELFTVHELIETLQNLTMPLAQKNNNELIIETPDAPAKLLSDRLKIRQILYNILSNACKFTHDGTIHLRVERTTQTGQEWYKCTIRDTGIGMSEEQLENVFEAFYQAESSSTRKYEGTGLGLTISKKFCDLLGGQMSVTSQSGEGTTFTVLLPLQFPTPL